MTAQHESSNYYYADANAGHHHAYLWPVILKILEAECHAAKSRKVFDLGCGNGSFDFELSKAGYQVLGVDPSKEGIRLANARYPELKLFEGSAEEDLSKRLGTFPTVICLEVVEHVYNPRRLTKCIMELLQPGGSAIISTPFHGYWKNLALSIADKWDDHFTALWDHGHIKFWSERTLSKLLVEAGFEAPKFARAGRWHLLAKSMIAVCRKPGYIQKD